MSPPQPPLVSSLHAFADVCNAYFNDDTPNKTNGVLFTHIYIYIYIYIYITYVCLYTYTYKDHNRYKFGIQDGLRFEFIAELIEHYHTEADGLCCILKRNVSTMAVEISPRELQMEAGLLGSGEFGEVRKALWRKRAGQGITVAVKVLKVPAGASEAADAEMQAFIDEGKTMVPLKHAFVVKLMGVVQEGQKMLVTEFMPLGAMNKFLKSKQKAGDPLPLQALLLFMKQIAEGMVYLEAQKVVHRDLASRNVLVQSENVCKISDFGMSRQVENYYKSSRKLTRTTPSSSSFLSFFFLFLVGGGGHGQAKPFL